MIREVGERDAAVNEERRKKGGQRAYERCGDGNDATSVPSLNHGRVDAFNGTGQVIKIASQEPVTREIIPEYIKKVHQSRGYIFWRGQIRRQR